MKRFDFIDLFAGIGGFHHALASLGGRCVMTCELDRECQQTYNASFRLSKSHKIVDNIRSLTRSDVEDEDSTLSSRQISRLVPDHDVLCAGFPCQPFSKSGAQQGIRDKARGTLFFDIMEIARAKRPKYMVLENVRNLAGPRHTATWRTIIDVIRDAGYRVCDEPLVMSPHLVPPDCGGAPQVRDRVFILCEYVGARGDKVQRANLLSRTHFKGWNPDKWRIADYLEPDTEIEHVERYRLKPAELTWLEAWDHFVTNIPSDHLPGHPIWVDAFKRRPAITDDMPDWEVDFRRKNSAFYCAHQSFLDEWMTRTWGKSGETVRDFPASRQKFEWQARKAHPGRKGRTLQDLVIQMRPSGIRVKPASYLPALVAITQTSIVGPKIGRAQQYRTLTPREAAKLQGIPEDVFAKAGVSDRAAYKQLGNAVNVGVVRLVSSCLMTGQVPDYGDSMDPYPLFAK
jgi:DNA (cytosine-5)-methyltransferase 1